jgi:S-adenosylmethionine:tRNA ribosyltransferase-isomerase
VHRGEHRFEHCVFKDIPRFFSASDTLVLNDTRVLPVRMRCRRQSGGAVEVFLLRRKHGLVFQAMFRPGRVRIGETLFFEGKDISCTRTGEDEVEFFARGEAEVYAAGEVPLPPYIKRQPEAIDRTHYQTVYARHDGSVAAPTAGLHFTEDVLRQIPARCAYLTLHVGYATFKAVEAEDVVSHPMGREWYCISDEAQRMVRQARESSGRVIATGTTACRALESWAGTGIACGETDLFIYPGYAFSLVDGLITNFHLPKTTLFMLVCALCGTELAHRAYQEAIREKYDFYSYGDAMMVL